MIILTKQNILLSILVLLGAYSFNVAAESFRIDDMRFSMQGPSFSEWNGTPTDPSPYGEYPAGTLVEGTYQGSNSTNELVRFTFFGPNVYVYTAATNHGAPNTDAGTITGGPEPTIDLTTLTADLSSWFATWNGTEFNQGNNSNFAACAVNSAYSNLSPIAAVTDNLDGTYVIEWNSCITGGAFNGQIGYWRLYVTCTTCPESTLGAADSLTATQGGNTTRTVIHGAGNVTVTSSFGVSPTGFGGSWTNTGSITDTDGDIGSFTFDPDAVTPGLYKFTYNYQDNTTTPATKGTGSIVIKVVASATVDVLDDDNDGISNVNDNSALNAMQLQAELGNSTAYVLQSDKGRLTLGQTAFCAGTGARITMDDITNYGSSTCTAVTNSDDSIIKSVGVGGFYDFEVHDLSLGATAQMVVPLTSPIPANATYRKYKGASGWEIFTVNNENYLASAPSTSPGVCPGIGDAAYTTGLNQGDDCLLITIKDGGPNDTDNSANGIIKDPGGIAQIESGVDARLRGNGCSMTANANARDHAEWLLVAGFIALLGWFKMSRRKA